MCRCLSSEATSFPCILAPEGTASMAGRAAAVPGEQAALLLYSGHSFKASCGRTSSRCEPAAGGAEARASLAEGIFKETPADLPAHRSAHTALFGRHILGRPGALCSLPAVQGEEQRVYSTSKERCFLGLAQAWVASPRDLHPQSLGPPRALTERAKSSGISWPGSSYPGLVTQQPTAGRGRQMSQREAQSSGFNVLFVKTPWKPERVACKLPSARRGWAGLSHTAAGPMLRGPWCGPVLPLIIPMLSRRVFAWSIELLVPEKLRGPVELPPPSPSRNSAGLASSLVFPQGNQRAGLAPWEGGAVGLTCGR